MKLLRDEEIVSMLTSDAPPIHDLSKPNDWYAKDSPVQAASVDLHIGKIYLPDASGKIAALWRKVVEAKIPTHSQHVLKPGHTAVVVTDERLELPGDLAAFGFPLSKVSFQGILITNPGHVDPGYNGHMRFTIINMGREQFVLRQGDPVITLLLFQLDQPAKKNWLARRPELTTAPNPTAEDLSRLSTQFLDIDNRARAISEKLISAAEFRIRVLTPLVAAIVGAIVGGLLAYSDRLFNQNPIDELNHEIIQLKEQVKAMDLENRLENLEEQVNGN